MKSRLLFIVSISFFCTIGTVKAQDYTIKLENVVNEQFGTLLESLLKDGKIDEAAETILNCKLSLAMVKWNLNMMDDKNDYSDFIAEVGDYLISKYILIEDDRLDDILEHNYKSNYNELAFLRTLLTTQKRCDFHLNFIKKENMGKMIYEICLSSLNSKILK